MNWKRGRSKEIEERLDWPRKLDAAGYHEIQDALRALQILSTDEQF